MRALFSTSKPFDSIAVPGIFFVGSLPVNVIVILFGNGVVGVPISK